MPRATTTGQETERHELKTCPGGWVELRRLTYGESLKRRQLSSIMRVEGGKDKNAALAGVIEASNARVTEFEFGSCIVDHNLEDDDGNKLNFKNVAHIHMLDPRIGDEIGQHIDRMHEAVEGDEVLGNYEPESTPVLS